MKLRSEKRNEGVALILTLLFVVLLTVLVVEFAFEAQVEASYSMNSGNEYEARLAARSAVYKGISVLENDKIQQELSASQNGTTTNRTGTTTGQGDADYANSQADSRWSSWAQPGAFEPLNDAVMRTTVTDEFGKINLNALVDMRTGERVIREQIQYALMSFFEARALAAGTEMDAEALVSSIIDWIDEDDEAEESGAESDFYLASETPYNAKNGPMDSIEELLLIKGMTKEFYFGPKASETVILPLSEYLTVNGDWLGRINPNTAFIDYEGGVCDVLFAMCEGWLEAWEIEIDGQAILDMMLNVEDESGVFQSTGELREFIVSSNLEQVEPNRPNQPNQPNQPNRPPNEASRAEAEEQALLHMFTTQSHIFRIHGDAMLDDILVRNEAFVLRIRMDIEWPRQPLTINGEIVQEAFSLEEAFPGGAQGGGGAPQEYYRILEWKVIQ